MAARGPPGTGTVAVRPVGAERCTPRVGRRAARTNCGYRAARADIDAAVARVLGGGRYILGDEVAAHPTRALSDVISTATAKASTSTTVAVRPALVSPPVPVIWKELAAGVVTLSLAR